MTGWGLPGRVAAIGARRQGPAVERGHPAADRDRGRRGWPGRATFSPDGKTFVTVGANGTAALWSVATGHRVGALMSAGAARSPGRAAVAAAFSPDGRILATAVDGSIRLWDTATRQQIGTPMTTGPGPAYAVAFSPDGRTLATAGADGTARLWDVATQQEIGSPMTAGPDPLDAVAFSPDGRTLTAPRRRPRGPGTWPSSRLLAEAPAPSRTNPLPASSGRLRALDPSHFSGSPGELAPRPGPRATLLRFTIRSDPGPGSARG